MISVLGVWGGRFFGLFLFFFCCTDCSLDFKSHLLVEQLKDSEECKYYASGDGLRQLHLLTENPNDVVKIQGKKEGSERKVSDGCKRELCRVIA